MMLNTKIEWATDTLNWWWGCSKVSPACEHCYAEMMCKLFGKGRAVWGPGGKRWIRDNAKRDALKILRQSGPRRRVFVNSMSDTFEDHPGLVEARDAALYFMSLRPDVDWLLLTKRPENVVRMVPDAWLTNWPAHIWIGTTVEDQKRADERIPALLAVPAKVRFLSCEPLLRPVTINDLRVGNLHWRPLTAYGDYGRINWVICGGESGSGARPMHPDWARGLRDQCQAAGVSFFFKQWGEWWRPEDREALIPSGVKVHNFEDGPVTFTMVFKVGKKAAGRLLDGREWNEVPA